MVQQSCGQCLVGLGGSLDAAAAAEGTVLKSCDDDGLMLLMYVLVSEVMVRLGCCFDHLSM